MAGEKTALHGLRLKAEMCCWGPVAFTLTFIQASPTPFPPSPSLLPSLFMLHSLPSFPSTQLKSMDFNHKGGPASMVAKLK